MLRTLTTIILLTGILAGCGQESKAPTPVQRAVMQELEHYPMATLQDIYKSFFQDAFGPGHLIPDKAIALAYLDRELATMKGRSDVVWQPLGTEENYYRVNLSLVSDSLLPRDELARAFVESANRAKPPTAKEWKKRWSEIMAELSVMDRRPGNFSADSISILRMLENGSYMVHHSETFSLYYHPHYRIVSRQHFQDLHERFLEDVKWEW